MERLSLGAGHLRQLLGLSQDADRLVRDLLAERREPHEAARAFDEGDSKQRLQLAQAGRERRLSDETGVRRLAEVPVTAERHQILKLLQAREVSRH